MDLFVLEARGAIAVALAADLRDLPRDRETGAALTQFPGLVTAYPAYRRPVIDAIAKLAAHAAG